MLFATVVFTACDNEDEGLWTHDIPGFEARIIVLDKEGNNLMDPNCENNIIGEISATYNGVTYECEDLFGIYEKPETETRVAYTPFLGLYMPNSSLHHTWDSVHSTDTRNTTTKQ